ncbi:MAG: rod shape-determining protein MreC [Anaerolineales bacterium]|jgi:rod shape-determining protein MreC
MKRPNSRLIVVGSLLLIAVALAVLSASGFLQPLQNLSMRPVTAIQTWFAVRYSAVRDLLSSPRDIAALQQEINRLEAENARLEQEIISLREQASEAEVLSALLNYARSQPENRYLAANVIGRDVSPFIRSVLINQGSDSGLAKGMPVVTARGLVGRVVEVFAGYSRVELITDPDTAVNVRFQTARTEGILTAELNGELVVDLIDLNAELTQGELVLTSGLGGKYPPNIPVGQVVSIRRRDFDLFQTATIQPSVDFDALNIVLVITNFQPVILESSAP